MEDMTRSDIRKFLKNFGILADEMITAHVNRYPAGKPLHLRIALEDLTEYDMPLEEELHLEVEGQIRR